MKKVVNGKPWQATIGDVLGEMGGAPRSDRPEHSVSLPKPRTVGAPQCVACRKDPMNRDRHADALAGRGQLAGRGHRDLEKYTLSNLDRL